MQNSGYNYPISKREIEKIALGMNCRAVAFNGINDYYIKGVEYEKLSSKGKIYKKVKSRIMFQNLLTKIKFRQFGLLIAIIFKQAPSASIKNRLLKKGYEVISLPKNPYY